MKHLTKRSKEKVSGLHGQAIFRFVDPGIYGEHGVIAYVLPVGVTPDDFREDMYGPLGFSSETDIGGKHLYGRDTWGTVTPEQIAVNPVLQKLSSQHQNQLILLAGVRQLPGIQMPFLNKPEDFVLICK